MSSRGRKAVSSSASETLRVTTTSGTRPEHRASRPRIYARRMQRLRVAPSGPLEGTIKVSGAKNSVLKLLAATTLAQGEYLLHNVPDILDVTWMGEVLARM